MVGFGALSDVSPKSQIGDILLMRRRKSAFLSLHPEGIILNGAAVTSQKNSRSTNHVEE
jgi:hypothetical protein